MITGAPLKAVLFDVGGPIADEREDFLFELRVISELIQEELGREIEESEIDEAWHRAISSWAPSFIKSTIWQFLEPDRERTIALYGEAIKRIFACRQDVTLMEGVEELIPKLAERYVLALAGNQPEFMREKLGRTGLLKHFASTILSSELGIAKPDSRFFLEICNRIGVAAESCCMIGDRLDNDIYPANVLGMRTIWLRLGPHAMQQPRIPEDVPDATIESISEVMGIIEGWEREESPRQRLRGPDPFLL
jgi:putative hydrolase of the HAD superfamily